MSNCLITLKPLSRRTKYQGYTNPSVKTLLGSLSVSPIVPFSRAELNTFPTTKGKMSISGYQPKISAKIEDKIVTIVKEGGEFIIKPSPERFPNLAQNEHALMSLAKACKFHVPDMGLITMADGELAYMIKRYDRIDGQKLQQEQLDAAMGLHDKFGKVDGEQVVSYARAGKFIAKNLKALEQYAEYFRRVIFSYIVGNNDHHLRNFSLLYTGSSVPVLSPVYDVVSFEPYPEYNNEYLCLPLLHSEEDNAEVEMESGFDRKYGQPDRYHFVQFGIEIGLAEKAAITLLDRLIKDVRKNIDLIEVSHMPEPDKGIVIQCINHRLSILADQR